jgi:calcineurin-like phosphoesterase family protein
MDDTPAKNIWFISDTHFSHANFLKFKDSDGNQIRKFDTVEQMDDCMITRWNECIKPGDKVYHLGDVYMENGHTVLPKLHGTKRLIVGNHDNIKSQYLYNTFGKIQMWRVFREYDFVCSHLPLREDNMITTFNLHGHIHQNPSPTARHMNICVEHTDYRPLHLDEILAELARRRNSLLDL